MAIKSLVAKARAHTPRMRSIDPTLGEAHQTIVDALLNLDNDIEGVARESQKPDEEDPEIKKHAETHYADGDDPVDINSIDGFLDNVPEAPFFFLRADRTWAQVQAPAVTFALAPSVPNARILTAGSGIELTLVDQTKEIGNQLVISSTLAGLPTAALGKVLISQGAGVQPIFDHKISLTGAVPTVTIIDESAGANSRRWYIAAVSGALYIDSQEDNTVLQGRFQFQRNGDLYLSGGVNAGTSISGSTLGIMYHEPNIYFNNTSVPINQGKWKFGGIYVAYPYAGGLHFSSTDDPGNIQVQVLTLDRTGQVNIFGPVVIGTNSAQSGAIRIVNNTGLYSRNAANTADIRVISTDNANNILVGDNTSNIYAYAPSLICSGSITERNRANPIGKKLPWTPTATTNEGAAIGGTITASYTLIGEMLFWSLYCVNFTIPTTTSLVRFTIPPIPPSVAAVEQISARLFVPGVGDVWGYAVVRATHIEFYRGATGNWPTGTGHCIGQGFYYI